MTVALMRQLEAKLLGRPLTDGGQVGCSATMILSG
jgi:hypothetical protein